VVRDWFGKDIFIDKVDQQKLGLKLFDVIQCQVYINDSSKPQAFNILHGGNTSNGAGACSGLLTPGGGG